MDSEDAGLVADLLYESGFDPADFDEIFDDLEDAAEAYGDGFDAFDIYSARASAYALDSDDDEIMDLIAEEF